MIFTLVIIHTIWQCRFAILCITSWIHKGENLLSPTTSHSLTNWYCWRRSDSRITFSIGSSTFMLGCAAMYLWRTCNNNSVFTALPSTQHFQSYWKSYTYLPLCLCLCVYVCIMFIPYSQPSGWADLNQTCQTDLSWPRDCLRKVKVKVRVHENGEGTESNTDRANAVGMSTEAPAWRWDKCCRCENGGHRFASSRAWALELVSDKPIKWFKEHSKLHLMTTFCIWTLNSHILRPCRGKELCHRLGQGKSGWQRGTATDQMDKRHYASGRHRCAWIETQDHTNSATHGTRWFSGHMLHRAVNNQDVIKMSNGHRKVVIR